jgi:uncharacterized membrane protein
MAMAGWYADPLGLHEKRFFNGVVWTERVTDGDVEGSNPLGNISPPPPYTPTVSGVAPPPPFTPTVSGMAPQYGAAPQYGVHPQYVVVAPRPTGNGFAIAALILGIVGVLFAGSLFGFTIGLICGVLALIFGLVGRTQVTTRGASSGGLATAGVVLGCIAIALGLFTVWRWNRIAEVITSYTPPTRVVAVEADPGANKVRVTTCHRDRVTLDPTAGGTLVNNSDRAQMFRVTVAFVIPGSRTEYGTGTTSEVLPGRSTFWIVREFGASFVPKSCKAVRSTAARP